MAQHGDLMAQDEQLDVLGGGRATQQREQPQHLHWKIKYNSLNDTAGSCTAAGDHQSPLVSGMCSIVEPHTVLEPRRAC